MEDRHWYEGIMQQRAWWQQALVYGDVHGAGVYMRAIDDYLDELSRLRQRQRDDAILKVMEENGNVLPLRRSVPYSGRHRL
jgi:hypothetical protein